MEKTPDKTEPPISTCEIKSAKLVQLGKNEALVEWLKNKGIPVQDAITQINPAPGFEIAITPTGKEGIQKVIWRKSSPKRLDECSDLEHLRQMVDKLWGLLDEIDTLPDMLHPNELDGYTEFYKAALYFSGQRQKILISDGFDLFITPPSSDG